MRQVARCGRRRALPFALALIVLPAAAVNAQDWNFEPTVRTTAETNDNVRLLRDDQNPIDSEALALDVTARMIRRAPLSEVRIIPRAQLRNFFNNDVDDTRGYFLDLFAERDLRRGQFGIEVRAAREDVLNAEIGDPDFDNPDVNDPIDLDTGRIQVDDERDRLIVDPFFGFSLTERFGIGVQARYVDVDYAQTSEVSDLRDYSSADLATELKYSISERGDLTFGVFVSDFESENEFSLNESQSFGGRLEYTYEFSEQFSAYAGVGYETIDTDTTSDGLTQSDTDNAALYEAGITREGEVSRTRLDVRQSVDPGGRGALQKRSQVRLRYTRQLSPRLFANLAARVQQTEETGEFGVDRDYQRYRAGLEWQFSQSWSIEGAYTYTAQDFSDQPSDADSNAFTISLIYEPPRRR